jgi:hypothetical protein
VQAHHGPLAQRAAQSLAHDHGLLEPLAGEGCASRWIAGGARR